MSLSTGASSPGESRGKNLTLQICVWALELPHDHRHSTRPKGCTADSPSGCSLYRASCCGGRRQEREADLSLALTSRIFPQSCTYFRLLPQHQNVPYSCDYSEIHELQGLTSQRTLVPRNASADVLEATCACSSLPGEFRFRNHRARAVFDALSMPITAKRKIKHMLAL